MEHEHDAEDTRAQQERALFLDALRHCLHSPHGFAVVLYLLTEAQTLESYAEPSEYRLRAVFDTLFRDIEEAAPDVAVRLFAHCRGIPPQRSGVP